MNSDTTNIDHPRARWAVCGIAAAAIVMAGCAADTQSADPPATPDVESAPPTAAGSATTVGSSTVGPSTTAADPPPTAPTSPTTTSAPTSTSPATTTSTTTSTSPSPPPEPSLAEATILVGSPGGWPWPVLGWWDGSDWVPGDEVNVDDLAAEGDEVEVVSLAGRARTVPVGAPAISEDERCPSLGFPLLEDLPTVAPPADAYSAVAVNAPWSVQPRPVVEAGADVAEYQQVGEALAATLGVDGASGDVTQVVRVDLTGDGFEEVIVVFEHVQPSIRGAAGDFSLVYVRMPTPDGTVADQVLASSAVAPDDELPNLTQYGIIGVADLNGDNAMELLLNEEFWEGAGATAWEVSGDSLTEVLAYRCGS